MANQNSIQGPDIFRDAFSRGPDFSNSIGGFEIPRGRGPMKNKWFWGSLAFWMIFAIGLTGRALIYSSLRFDPQIISRYEIKTNGLVQSHKIWVNEGSLTALVPLVDDLLRQDGWSSCANSQDLVPDLLQLDGLVPDISDRVQIKMFQKPGLHLALGLLQDTS